MMANSMVSELQKLAHYSIIETVGIYISFTCIVGKSKGGWAVKSGAYFLYVASSYPRYENFFSWEIFACFHFFQPQSPRINFTYLFCLHNLRNS